ncbi:MAG: hypothetical protein QOF21_1956 [Actinomycetota bacterium]
MKLEEFQHRFADLWDVDPQDADHPRDRRFRQVVGLDGAMATENKLALLNTAAAHLDSGEVYLEVGAFRGTSIVGAATDNPEASFVTVDNFSQFDGSRERFWQTVRASGSKNIDLREGDFREVLRTGLQETIGVYFYDGPHSFRDQWDALELVEPHLSDRALVIVDDASARQVRAANRAFARCHPRFALLRRLESAYNGEPRWWNGIEIYTYDRSKPNESLTRHIFYWSGRFLYGGLFVIWHVHLRPPIRVAGSRIKRLFSGPGART